MFFSLFAKAEEAARPAPYDDYRYSLVGSMSQSGVRVTPETALKASACYAAVMAPKPHHRASAAPHFRARQRARAPQGLRPSALSYRRVAAQPPSDERRNFGRWPSPSGRCTATPTPRSCATRAAKWRNCCRSARIRCGWRRRRAATCAYLSPSVRRGGGARAAAGRNAARSGVFVGRRRGRGADLVCGRRHRPRAGDGVVRRAVFFAGRHALPRLGSSHRQDPQRPGDGQFTEIVARAAFRHTKRPQHGCFYLTYTEEFIYN